MKKVSSLSLLLLLLTLSSWGQYDARVQLNLGNFSPLDKNYKDQTFISCNPGISVQHRIYKNFGIKLSYSQWYDIPGKLDGFHSNDDVWVNGNFKQIPYYNKGAVLQHINYHMLDVSVYLNQQIGEKHTFYGAVGLSKAWGTDEFLVQGYDPNDWVCIIPSEFRKASYYGTRYEAGYNYLMFKRINIGPSFVLQSYPKQFNQYTLSFNVGYNFNFVKK